LTTVDGWCIIGIKEKEMSYQNYEYDYHNLADDADFIEQDEYYYYDDGSNEPWMDEDDSGWENSYHNLANEIDD
jgi:hypothetical protein